MTHERASWDEAWMAVADAVAKRSACTKTQVGAAIVSASNRILATGYNGAPARLSPFPWEHPLGDCRDWCARPGSDNPSPCYEDCFSVHAEANAIAFVDRTLMEGGCLYITTNPCFMCSKQVANSGIVRAVYRNDTPSRDPDGTVPMLFERCHIEVVEWPA